MTCSIKEHKFFDTHWSRKDADKLAKYLYYLPYDSHVIILTLGEAFGNMTDSAFDELEYVGVDISDVAEEGQTFAALVVIGSHCRTMYELYEDEPAYLYFQLNGTCLEPNSTTRTPATNTGYTEYGQGYRHHQRTSSQQFYNKFATPQCQSPTSRHVKMLGCGKFLSVGGVRSRCSCSGVWLLQPPSPLPPPWSWFSWNLIVLLPDSD